MSFRPRLTVPWAWGTPDGALSPEERELIGAFARHRLGVTDAPRRAVPSFALASPRLAAPASLRDIVVDFDDDRLAHAWGKSFADLARAREGRADHAPDLVAYPRDERDIEQLLDWASGEGVAVIAYGGGSSVVGGVTPDVGDGYAGTVSVDLQRLDRVLEVDAVSRAARVQAGVLGPSLADQLRSSDLALRHFPQSYEFSTLGGWIATRSGGHYATGRTRIDDFVEAVRVVSPSGAWETLRVPSSGAGPDAVRWVLGSEGSLGIITQAWIRLEPRPRFKASATVHFASLSSALHAVREIAQSGMWPASLRLLDRVEAMNSFVHDGSSEVLVLGFESAHHHPAPLLAAALECCTDHGGVVASRVSESVPADRSADPARAHERDDESQAWRAAFLRMPYIRDALMDHAVICETFETACTWDRAESVVESLRESVRAALAEQSLDPSSVSFRFTHAYPDGIAPYVTVLARGRHGRLDTQWQAVKDAAGEALVRAGATITHHHAVGRDHMTWYEVERPGPYGAALAAAREALDPRGVMNPGVLLRSGSS